MTDYQPTRDLPWVRVRDADGHELDRHYQDPGIESGEFTVIAGYPPNQTAQARPHKYRIEKGGAAELKGDALDAAIDKAGLTEQAKGLRADEKRGLLAAHDAETDPSNPEG